MATITYEQEMIDRFLGKQVKHSEYSMRTLRDAWLSAGAYNRKASYRRQYDAKQAERGTCTAVSPANHSIGSSVGLVIQWDNGCESRCLPYLAELAE